MRDGAAAAAKVQDTKRSRSSEIVFIWLIDVVSKVDGESSAESRSLVVGALKAVVEVVVLRRIEYPEVVFDYE